MNLIIALPVGWKWSGSGISAVQDVRMCIAVRCVCINIQSHWAILIDSKGVCCKMAKWGTKSVSSTAKLLASTSPGVDASCLATFKGRIFNAPGQSVKDSAFFIALINKTHYFNRFKNEWVEKGRMAE